MSETIDQDDSQVCIICGIDLLESGSIVCNMCKEEFKSDDPIKALQNKCDMLEEIFESCKDQIFALNETLKIKDSKIQKLESNLRLIRLLTNKEGLNYE